MITTVLFDMGNVLTKYNARDYISSYVKTEEDIRLFDHQICRSVEWMQMDRGILSDEEAILSVCNRLPERLHESAARFIREFRLQPETNPEIEQLVREIKEAGYRLILFSNTSYRFHNFSKFIPAISLMDEIWISCEHKVLKPEPESYQSVLKKFELKPEECYFIDDSPANIEAALRFGIRGCIFHQDIEELRNNLRRNDILH